MGTGNSSHNRKAKTASQLRRKRARRKLYDKVLIVCEGAKTEPNYFKELIRFYRLNTANVEIDGAGGSSPTSVFSRAIELWEIEKKTDNPFDRVYCVFDKDSHESYDKTVTSISNKAPKDTFFATTSVPCFEYWLLLHFKYTTSPYAVAGKSSIGDQVLRELKKSFPNYVKGSNNIFSSLSDKLEMAKTNAEKSLSYANSHNSDNPSTTVHQLVEYLQNLKQHPSG